MNRSIRSGWGLALACLLLLAQSWALAQGSAAAPGPLVSAEWLERNLGRSDLLLIDASPPPLHAAGHIAGAVPVDVYNYAAVPRSVAEMERFLQSWGVSPGRTVVLYDQGGTMLATRVFYDLVHHGFPASDLHLLDGGLARWKALGKPVTKDKTPAPAAGSFRVTQIDPRVRVRLPEFLVASGDPARHALVEALEPSYYYGATQFFDRPGHVPNALLLPAEDFYQADKTFKPIAEIRRMVSHLGIRPEQQVHTYCGGGVAASVPFFALKYLLGFPQVTLYQESQLEWLRDERGLPFWTYAAPNLRREMQWVAGWNSPMMRMYGVSRLNLIDVRPAEAYGQGHVPFALNVAAAEFRRHLAAPEALAPLLGPAGVNAEDEAVIVSDGGLNPASALAFLVLQRLGQSRVSILMESMDEWGLRGQPLVKEPTSIGRPKSMQDIAVMPAVYRARPRADVVTTDAGPGQGAYPRLFIAAGKAAPARPPAGRLVHLPYTELLNKDGTPKAAKDLWALLDKAGVSRYAEIVAFADDPGEAAVTYYVLKLMGFADVKVLLG